MELTYLQLDNFLSFKSVEHNFINSPVLIQGKNLTEVESKETNGAGKSTIMAGIAYAILANSLKKQTLDRDLIMWGEEQADIFLDIYCPIRNQTLNIHRTLRSKGSALLELFINGESGSVQFATVNDGNSFILNWIGISAEDLKNYFIINKENFKSFVSSSNTDKLALISRFIKADKLDEVDDLIKEKNAPLQQQTQNFSTQQYRIEGELSVYKDQLQKELERDLEAEKEEGCVKLDTQMSQVISRYDKSEELIKNAKLTIKLSEDKIEELKIKLATLNKSLLKSDALDFAKKYETIEIKKDKTSKEIKEKTQQKENTRKFIAALNLEISKLNKLLEEAVECPKCHHKFSILDPNKEIKDIQEDIVSKGNTEVELQTEYKQIEDNLRILSDVFSKHNQEINLIRTEEQEHIKAIRTLQTNISNIQYEINRHKNLILSTQQEIARLETILKECDEESMKILDEITALEEAELQTKEEEIQGIISITEKKLQKIIKEKEKVENEISENLQWGLRLKEFRMFLACEQLRIIQNFANIILQRQRSELRLSIDGFKRNAKGVIKSEITVSVINGEGEYKSFWSFSGGERARIEIALIEAFQEMINGTNPYGGLHFLMVDEVLEGTDPLGLSLLMESLEETGFPVYIISHVMNIKAGIKTLTVIKENGQSYIE